MSLIYIIKQKLFKIKWRKKNPQNSTTAETLFDDSLVTVGSYSYGPLRILNEGKKFNLKVGSFCSIADNTYFILESDHKLNALTTYPYHKLILKDHKTDSISKGSIEIGDDVWIGQGAIILSGVKVGQGAVVAAGAVVNKNIPAYAVAGGVPAKILKYRFPPEMRELLCRIDYSKITDKIISENESLFSENVKDMSVIKIEESLCKIGVLKSI